MKILNKLLFILILGLQFWFLFVIFSFHANEIKVGKNNNGQWAVVDINESYKNPDIRIGDELKSINGIEADKHPSVQRWGFVNQAEVIIVNRNGEEIEVSFKEIPRFSGVELLAILGGIMSLLIAISLYRKMLSSLSARYLSSLLLIIGLTFLSLGASIRGDILGKIFIGAMMMLIPVVFVNFLIVFLKEKGGIHLPSGFLKYLYYFIVILSFGSLIIYIPLESTYSVYLSMRTVIMLFFVVGLCINLYFLTLVWVKYRKEKTYISTIIKSVWLALFVSFSPIICFSFIPSILYGFVWIDPFVTGWFVLFLPLTFAYLISAKRLYDIDMILRRIMLAAAISVVPSGIFIGIIRILLQEGATLENLLIIFILFELIFTFMLYSLEYFTTKLEPVMFPRKYQLQTALRKISKSLGSITSFRELKEIILVDLVNTLQVFGGAIVFKYKDTIEVIHQGDMDVTEVELLVVSGDWDNEDYSCFEVNRQEEYSSYLIMTQKKTKTLLGTEERQWLSLIITYLAVSLENVHLIRKLTMKLQHLASHLPDEQMAGDLNWFRKLMFELQEKERVRIATELHDTTMQDLFFLKERLHTLLEKYMFSVEDKAQMINIIEYIDVINSNLRQSCFELHPYLLKEVGLVQTIEKLVEFEMAVCSFELEFVARHAYHIEQWDMDRKKHIFRMIQELINNAKKHSHASRVRITLDSAHHMIYLNYEDDGLGFDPNHTVVKEIGGSGIGMEQMKSRVLSLNGHFELATSKGTGVKFAVTIPMKEGQIA
jgi:two-component system sensor histidine kinase ComP